MEEGNKHDERSKFKAKSLQLIL